MEPAQILLTSSVLLAVAAAGGLVMAGIRFVGDRSPPPALAMLHGFLAAAAVTLLAYAAATVGLPKLALVALALFLVAAGGGAILNLNYHWKQLPLPKWLVVVHAGAAVLGFVLRWRRPGRHAQPRRSGQRPAVAAGAQDWSGATRYRSVWSDSGA